MLVKDWLMGKGCLGYLDTDETACNDSSGESDSGVVPVPLKMALAMAKEWENRGRSEAHARGQRIGYDLLYFSASWCVPCQKITSTKKWYLQYQKYWEYDISGGKIHHNPTGKMIDVLWIGPSEKTLESYNKYRSNMPWHSTSFGSKQHWFLTKYYQINSFPTFVLIGRDGRVLLRTNCKEGLEDMTDMIK